MKNVITSVVLLLVGALLYHFLRPVLDKNRESEQVIWGPQVYLYSLEVQEQENLAEMNASIDALSRDMEAPKSDIAGLTRSLKSINEKARLKQNTINASRMEWNSTYSNMTSLRVNPPPVPPPPPPPCIGCNDLRFFRRKPFILYHSNPVIVRILSKDGKELAKSTPGSASQTSMSGNAVKIVLDLSQSGYSGGAVLSIEGGAAGIAQAPVEIVQ